jgi:P-type Ca2+ transporter type 2C
VKGYSAIEVNNMAFYTLVLAQLLNVFNLPHRRLSFFNNEVISNPWVWGAIFLSMGIILFAYYLPYLNQVLNLVPLSMEQLLAVIIFGFLSLIITQLIKKIGMII